MVTTCIENVYRIIYTLISFVHRKILTYSLSNVKDLNKYALDCALTPTGSNCQKESRVFYAKVGISNYYSAFFSDYYGDYYTNKRKLENMEPRKDGIQDVL